jgi:acetoin utilization protein AcuC
MRGKLVYPYTDALMNYEFSPEHPLKPDRLRLTYLLSKDLGLIDKVQVIEPTIATREELELFHTPEFIDAVIKCGTEECADYRYGLGTMDNPVFPKIYDAAARYVGATVDGIREVMKGASNAFVISGGLHHAQRAEASGFCVFNDIVVAIMELQRKMKCRVLYLDIFDAHHGDGVQNAFYRSKDVLTISMHQNGRSFFPGTGFVYEYGAGDATGYSVNIPVIPGASSAELIEAFNEIVVPLFEAYRPDLLVSQLGVDSHYLDPLANLAYSSYGYETVLKRMRDLSNDICKIGWLALGGGGYHPINVARLWTLFLAVMLDEKVPQEFPDEFKTQCTELGFTDFPEGMRDKTEVVQLYYPRDEIQLDLDRVIRRIKEEVFPYHGL